MYRELRAPLRAAKTAIACVSLVVACGGKSETTPEALIPVARGDSTLLFGSGTRLKAHYLDAGGGARELLAFHDSVLDIECRFVATAVGAYACLPIPDTYEFADAACSAPVLEVTGACPNAPAPLAGDLISARSTDCAAQTAAYAVDGQQAQAQTSALTAYGICRPWAAAGQPHTVWTTKPEPLTRFVQGTVSTVGAVGGVQSTRVTADDGAFTTLSLVTDGIPCIPTSVDGVQRCVPTLRGQRFLQASTEANCSAENVAIASPTLADRCALQQPHYVSERTGLNCGTTTIYALGESLSAVFVSGDTCESRDLAHYVGNSFYRMGKPVSSSVFPEAPLVRISTGALTMRFIADRTGAPLLQAFDPWTLLDGTLCTVLTDASGQKRCLYDWISQASTSYFADANCTQPVYMIERASCSTGQVRYIVDGEYSRCRADFTQVYTPKPYAGPVYSPNSGSCQAIEPLFSNAIFLAVGDPIDASIFPALAEATDP